MQATPRPPRRCSRRVKQAPTLLDRLPRAMLEDRLAGGSAAASSRPPADSHIHASPRQRNHRDRERKEFLSLTAGVNKSALFNGTGDTSHASFEICRDQPAHPPSISFGSSPRASLSTVDCEPRSSIIFSTWNCAGYRLCRIEAIWRPVATGRKVLRSCKSIETPLHSAPL